MNYSTCKVFSPTFFLIILHKLLYKSYTRASRPEITGVSKSRTSTIYIQRKSNKYKYKVKVEKA